jgi:tetratricopeptide (TPR) repeat protein
MAEEPQGEDRRRPFQGFRVEVDPEDVDAAVKRLREGVKELSGQLSGSFAAGRYTKVRISYKGRALLPDLPLAIFLATEGVAFWLISPLPALLINLGAKALLEVEFVHEADELVQEGLSLYLDGELEEAEARYREALRRRPNDPAALYNLGTLLRVTGRRDEAIATLRKAAMGAEGHPDVVRASEALDRLTTPKRTL